MRELPAYVLTFARNDRRLGAQIRATEADCSGARQLAVDEIRAQARDGWPPCGVAFMVSFVDSADAPLKVRMRRSAITMKEFATALQASVDRPVVDRTGLEGFFDLEYSFAQQPASTAAGGADSNQPMLIVALEEQLGLKLESRRTDVPGGGGRLGGTADGRLAPSPQSPIPNPRNGSPLALPAENTKGGDA